MQKEPRHCCAAGEVAGDGGCLLSIRPLLRYRLRHTVPRLCETVAREVAGSKANVRRVLARTMV